MAINRRAGFVRWKIHFFVGDKWCYDIREAPPEKDSREVLAEWWNDVNSEEYTDFATEGGKSTMRVLRGSIAAAEIRR